MAGYASMNTRWNWWRTRAALLAALMILPGSAFAQDGEDADEAEEVEVVEEPNENNGPSAGPNAAQLSETQTTFNGARLLRADTEVSYERFGTGLYGDIENRDHYAYWSGDSLFTGSIDEETGNRVDAIAEFYWFESSLPRQSDFYVVVLKVNSEPLPNSNWRVATEADIFDDILFREIGPAQRVRASVDRSGDHGAIRWDWSAPFQNYRWEPARVIEVEQSYTAGLNAEGTAMKSLTEGVSIQAKGFLNAEARVSTRYTITLWRWAMQVQAGATDMDWYLTALDPEHDTDPAYHEYFLVMQAPRGAEARIDTLNFGTTLRQRRGGLLDAVVPDRFMDISVQLSDIRLRSPRVLCVPGFIEEDGVCIPDCGEGFLPEGELCIPDCDDGFAPDGDRCVPICEEGARYAGGECVSLCDVDSQWVNGRCEDRCEEGQRWENEACVQACQEGFVYENGECIPSCDPGFLVEGNNCVPNCGEGFTPVGDRCVPECDEGYIPAGSRCVLECDEGYVPAGDICVRDCGANLRPQGDECVPVCPDGFRIEEQGCVPECGAGFRAEGARCVPDCADGYRPQGNQCVRDCPEGSRPQGSRCVSTDVESLRCGPGTRLEGRACVADVDTSDVRPGEAAEEFSCSSTGTGGSVPFALFLLALYGMRIRRRR